MSLQMPPKHQTGLPGYDLVPLDDQLPAARPPRFIDPESPPARTMDHPVVTIEPRSMVPGVFAVVILGAMLFGLSWQRELLIGQLLAGCAVPLALLGLFKGGSRKVIMLAAIIGSVFAGSVLPGAISPWLEPWAGTSAMLVSYLLTAVMGIIALFLARGVGRRTRNRLERVPMLSSLDRVAGVVIGAAEGALLVLTLCWTCVMLEPQAERLRDLEGAPIDSVRRQLAGQVIRVAREASAGPLGEFIRATNPIEKFPALKQVIDDLNETGRLNIEGLNPGMLRSLQQMLDSQADGRSTDLNALLDQYHRAKNQSHGH